MTDSLLIVQQGARMPLTLSHDWYARADEHPALVYLASLGKGSQRTMRTALDTMARLLAGDSANYRTLPWHALRFQHTQAVRAALLEQYAPATVNKHLVALRQVIQTARQLGYLSADEAANACAVKPVKFERLPRGRSLASGEIAALIAACTDDSSALGFRDGALISVAYSTGARRGELAALTLSNYQPADGSLAILGGKGRKDRMVYLETGAQTALDDWLSIRGRREGPLFCSILKSGTLTYECLSEQAIYAIMEGRGMQAGVQNFSPHDFRRTFISDLLDADVDIATVQKLAGHADPATTGRYDRRGEEVKRKAVRRLHVPYSRRK